MARTTVDIETPILKEIKNLQKQEGRSLSKTVSQLLTEALAQRRTPGKSPRFRWSSRPMGALVDISDKDAIYKILDKGRR